MACVLSQNQLIHKSIDLFEANQKGKRPIVPQDREHILRLREEGMSQADIARLLRISNAAVSQILSGKYPSSQKPCDFPNVSDSLERLIEQEALRLSKQLEPLSPIPQEQA